MAGVLLLLDLVRDVSLPGKAVCRCQLSGTAVVRHGRAEVLHHTSQSESSAIPDQASNFVVLPMRWNVVERTLA